MLASLGALHVVEAVDGRAALGVIQDLTQPIDIIICDLDMPGMDGMEFIRHVGEAGVAVSMILSSALENLVRLRIKGFGLSIDDYGTGYSSMQQLSRIPFTELKIDQSFVMSATEKDSCRVILESSLDMARKLGLKVVAEGVETRADWKLLKILGCDTAQGYLIARPMAATQIADWASAWGPPE